MSKLSVEEMIKKLKDNKDKLCMNTKGEIYTMNSFEYTAATTDDTLVEKKTFPWHATKIVTKRVKKKMYFKFQIMCTEHLGSGVCYGAEHNNEYDMRNSVEIYMKDRMRFLNAVHHLRMFKAHNFIEAIV